MSVESIHVSKIMITNVKTATLNETVYTVAKLMYENSIGSIVIVKRINEENKPVGIITERDIVRLLGSSELFSSQVSIRGIMRSPLFTISQSSSITDAIITMQEKRIRRLPVIDQEEKMIGIITERDIFKAIARNQTIEGILPADLSAEHRDLCNKFIHSVVWR